MYLKATFPKKPVTFYIEARVKMEYNKRNKLGFVELFEDGICTSALHSPQGEGGPPLGGG